MDSDLIAKILRFRDERDWKQFHNPKDLAISISLEAAELLENFQWAASSDAVLGKKENICDELADVFIYCVLLADALNVDINSIIPEKLEQNARKYPVDKAYGKKEKYTDL
jgi:NTP pyrophosphatase (non-canonical NTP hydrolase)